MAYPEDPLPVIVEIYLGSEQGWVDITDYVLIRDGIIIRRGFQDEDRTPRPSECTFTLNNKDGRFSPRNPLSPYYGLIGRNTLVRVRVDLDGLDPDDRIRFVGEISEWPLRWDVSEAIVPTTVTAQGILRRLRQGTSPIRSPLTAALIGYHQYDQGILNDRLVAYWPMEDASPTFHSLVGGPRLYYRGTAPDTGEQGIGPLLGSNRIPVLASDTRLIGTVLPYTPVSPLRWAFLCVMDVPPTPGWADNTPIVHIHQSTAGSTVATWELRYKSANDLEFRALDSTGAQLGTSGTLGLNVHGQQFAIVIDMASIGGLSSYQVGMYFLDDGGELATGSQSGFFALEANAATEIQIAPNGGLAGLAIGQIAVDRTAALQLQQQIINAFAAHAGERAANRAERLANELGLPFETIGSNSETQPMGQQAIPSRFFDALDETWRADLGLMFESREELGLRWRTRSNLYNRPVKLTLDYTACGEIAPDLEPTDDDQRVHNDIELRRKNGASFRAVDLVSRMGIADPPDGVGRYEDQVEVNVRSDEQLPNLAYWHLHLGTWDEARFPRVQLNLAAAAAAGKWGLVFDACGLDVGDRFRLTNLPLFAGSPTGVADLMVVGFEERIGHPTEWEMELNAVPYGPWSVPEYAGPTGGEILPMSGTLTTNGAGTQANLDFTGLNVDLRGPKMIRLVISVDKPEELGNISLFLGVGGLTNHIRWLFHIRSSPASMAFLPNEQTMVTLQIPELQSVGGSITQASDGTPSVLSGFTHARLAATDRANGEAVTITLHSAAVVSPARPNAFVSITFDDGEASVIEKAWPKMREYGFRGTQYIIVEHVGEAGKVTMADLQAQYAEGWEIGGHAYASDAHSDRYTGLTAAEALADMQANVAWLEQHFPSSRGYTMAYPNGEFSETTDGQSIEDITVTAGYKAARTTMSNPGSTVHLQIESIPPPILTRLYGANLWEGAGGQLDPQNLIAPGGMLDRIEANGGWLILVFHDIVEGTASSPTEVSQEDFDAIMDALAERSITVAPVRDVLAMLPEPGRYDTAGCQTIQGLWLRGASDSYVSTPSAAPLQITGDLDVRAYISPASWTPATAQHIVSKDNPSGNQRGYRLRLNTDGTISLLWSPNGVDTLSVTSTAAPTVGPSGARAIRAVLDVNNGSGGHTVTFYEAATLDGPWTQLGSSGSDGSGTTSIFASTADLRIGVRGDGTQPFEGVIHVVEVRSGIDGTVVADPDFTAHDTGDTSISDDAGNTWTVQANAEIVDEFDGQVPGKLMVVTTFGPRWTTSPDDMPFVVRCAGVDLTVTAVEGTGKPQVFTISEVSLPKEIDPGEALSLSSAPVYSL